MDMPRVNGNAEINDSSQWCSQLLLDKSAFKTEQTYHPVFCSGFSEAVNSFCYQKLEGVQGGSNVVPVGDGGTDEKTGGGDRGGRVEDEHYDFH